MKLFIHYCPQGFSNSYILGSERSSDAVIIDPGAMDEKILSFIEKHDYNLRGILITHDHDSHVRGLKTLKRIYDAEVFAGDPTVCEQRASIIHDGDILEIGSFKVKVYSVPGHSSDSVAYGVDKLLFTGDALSAGLIGSTVSAYGRSILADALNQKILTLPGETIVLPGHGPPSSIEVERRFNVGLEAAKQAGAQRAAFVRDIW